jgi:hypothetical protein
MDQMPDVDVWRSPPTYLQEAGSWRGLDKEPTVGDLMRKLVLQTGVTLDGFVAGPRKVTAPQDDELLDAKTFPSGALGLVYQPRTTPGR